MKNPNFLHQDLGMETFPGDPELYWSIKNIKEMQVLCMIAARRTRIKNNLT